MLAALDVSEMAHACLCVILIRVMSLYNLYGLP